VDEKQAIVIPSEVVEMARRSIGVFFERISKADPETNIQDFLDASKAFKRAEILEKYVPLRSKKVLEIGSGFGTNLAVWMKHLRVDGYGVEPGSIGFNGAFLSSLKVFSANGLDPDRIVDARGESLPFPDECFDIVYSANVLEHTENPELVLEEAVRVLKPGGTLHMEMPNFLSYFEGHYLAFQPPLVCEKILPWWIKWIYRRDPSFAKTLHTRINPIWCRRNVRRVSAKYPIKLISVGEDVFLDRLSHRFKFEMQTVRSRLGVLLSILDRLNVGNWLGKLIVLLRGHYPIYLTCRKLPTAGTSSQGTF
jgi:ubiquinone/menaquinone biosynthesis C-methylase UbiE